MNYRELNLFFNILLALEKIFLSAVFPENRNKKTSQSQ